MVMKSIVKSIKSIKQFWHVIWNWRWYDFSYTLDIMVRDLQLREEQWGVNTHYVGDTFTKKRIQVLLRMYDRYLDAEDIKEEDKALKLFLRTYVRTVPKLWD